MKVALLISGSGTTAEAVVKAAKDGKLKGVEIVGVISSNANAAGLMKAKKLGIPTFIIDPVGFSSEHEFGDELLKSLKGLRVGLVSQNGWLPLTPLSVIEEYKDRIINQHPGPLDMGRPDFGGKSMFGSRVMCSRLLYCWMTNTDLWTQATTHFVTDEYDRGAVIRTEKLALPDRPKGFSKKSLGDYLEIIRTTTQEVQKELLPLEHKNVIATLQLFTRNDTVKRKTRKTPLVPIKYIEVLELSKKAAKQIFPHG